jgi:hypothetical protein
MLVEAEEQHVFPALRLRPPCNHSAAEQRAPQNTALVTVAHSCLPRGNGNACAEQVGLALSGSHVCQVRHKGMDDPRNLCGCRALSRANLRDFSCAEPGALPEPFPLATKGQTTWPGPNRN